MMRSVLVSMGVSLAEMNPRGATGKDSVSTKMTNDGSQLRERSSHREGHEYAKQIDLMLPRPRLDEMDAAAKPRKVPMGLVGTSRSWLPLLHVSKRQEPSSQPQVTEVT